MKQLGKIILAFCAVLLAAPAFAQDDEAPARGAQAPRDPHIVSPGPTPNLKPLDAPKLPYHFVHNLTLPAGMVTTLVSGVALTPQGHVIFLTRNPAAMLLEFDANDKFIRTFNPNMTIGPHGLRVDRHGDIWVLDSFLNVVWKLNPKGEPYWALGDRGNVKPWDDAKWNGAFNQPLDISFDKDDDFFIIQGHGGTSNPLNCVFCMSYAKANSHPTQGSDPRVFKFDKNGNYLASHALPHADGTYPTLHTTIVTPKGELWVSDRQAHVIKVLDTNLNPLREIAEPTLISGLYVDAKGTIWMSAGMDGMLMRLDDNGKIVGWIGERGRIRDNATNPDAIGEAHFLAVTPDEQTIYLADSVNGKMVELKHD